MALRNQAIDAILDRKSLTDLQFLDIINNEDAMNLHYQSFDNSPILNKKPLFTASPTC